MNVTIVTGASRGIGRAIAKRLAPSTHLLVVGTSKERLAEVIEGAPNTSAYFAGDVRDAEFAKAVVGKAMQMGKLVNVILSAGISKAGSVEKFPDATLRDLFEVNFFGSVNFAKAALASPDLQNIMFLAGTAGIRGYSSMTGYCATKHALVGYARALAQEVSKRNVRVVPICPGPTDTDMTAGIVKMLVGKGMTEDAAKAKIASGDGLKAMLTPEDVADTVERIINESLLVINGEPVKVEPKAKIEAVI